MNRSRRWGAAKISSEVPRTPGERRMIGNLKMEVKQLHQRLQKTLCLPPGQTQEQPKVKGSLDRDIRVPTLAATAAGFLGCSAIDRLGREPYCQASTLDQATIVGWPVGDAVASLVIRVDLRPLRHPRIMIQEPRRGKRGRTFRFMHQRRCSPGSCPE